jgi:CBS domain-containing protein
MVSVRDVMTTGRLVTVHPTATILDAARKMHEAQVGSVLVVDDKGKLLGIFTERDLVRVIATGVPLDTPIERVMTTRLITALPDESLAIVASRMIEHGIRHIPVVDETGRLVGIVSMRDVLRHVVASSAWP